MRFRGSSRCCPKPLRGTRRLAGLSLALMAVLSGPLRVAAQCDADKVQKATAGASGYQRIDDTLCEGIYGKDVSGDVLSFVSLTEPMSLETYEPLHIA